MSFSAHKMMNSSNVPCHPRIKRILNSYQESAEYSLRGPTENVGDRVNTSGVQADIARKVAKIASKPNTDSRCFGSIDDAGAVVPVKIARRELDSVSSLSPPEASATVTRPLMMIPDARDCVSELEETVLEGRTIACFIVSGERRLCMPQVLNSVLVNLPPRQIQEMSDALHIHYAECSSSQLDTLKRRGILPMHIPRCGLITQTDAERLCAVLLHSRPEPCRYARAGDVRIPVSHECFGGCKGILWPRDYTSPSSLCIECGECGGRLSTMQFVSHSHSPREDRICHWGFDATNWRFYLLLADDATRMVEELPKMRKMLDDVKALYINSDSSEKSNGNKVRQQLAAGSATTAKNERLVDPVGQWKPVNSYKTWAACLNVVQRLKHAQHENSSSALPPYLYTGIPVLENPDRVVPFDDEDRYDRNFAPNVSLALEPFDELRKLREELEAEEDAKNSTIVDDSCRGDRGARNEPSFMWRRRRSTYSSCDNQQPIIDDDADDDDSDNESVSSDKLESEEESKPEVEVARQRLLPVDLEHQLAYVKSAVIESDRLDQSTKLELIKQFSMSQDRHIQIVKSIAGNQKDLDQALIEVWSLLEIQRQEAAVTKKRYEEDVARLRQEAAAKMREAALERHHLLQQIEALSGKNASSEQAAIAARYKEEAERWKSRLMETEAVNKRLQQEIKELRAMQPQAKVWKLMTAAPSVASVATSSISNSGGGGSSDCRRGSTAIAVLFTDDVDNRDVVVGGSDVSLTPPQSM